MPEQVEEKKINERYSARLKETLELDGSPVAVSFTLKPPYYLKEWRRNATVCLMIQAARRGISFYSSGSSIICGGGQHLGIGKSPVPDIKKALVQKENLVASEQAAIRRLEQVRQRVPKKGSYVIFTPLEKAHLKPDVVLFIGKPIQISRILHLALFETGEIDTLHGEPLCSGVIGIPVTTGKIGISFLDMTCRTFGKYGENELAIGLPYERVATVIRSISKSSSGTAKLNLLGDLIKGAPSEDG